MESKNENQKSETKISISALKEQKWEVLFASLEFAILLEQIKESLESSIMSEVQRRTKILEQIKNKIKTVPISDDYEEAESFFQTKMSNNPDEIRQRAASDLISNYIIREIPNIHGKMTSSLMLIKFLENELYYSLCIQKMIGKNIVPDSYEKRLRQFKSHYSKGWIIANIFIIASNFFDLKVLLTSMSDEDDKSIEFVISKAAIAATEIHSGLVQMKSEISHLINDLKNQIKGKVPGFSAMVKKYGECNLSEFWVEENRNIIMAHLNMRLWKAIMEVKVINDKSYYINLKFLFKLGV